MYQYMEGSRRYSLRWILRQIRAILIILVLPLAYWLTKPSCYIWLYPLTALGLALVVAEFRHGKKQLVTAKRTLSDGLMMIGNNLFYGGFVLCGGGLASPLAGFLLIPALIYTIEYGFAILLYHLPLLSLLGAAAYLLSGTSPGGTILFHLFTLLFFAVFLSICLSYQSVTSHQDQKIRHLLTRDELTGLSNRRYLKAKMLESNKQGLPFALVNLDINYFKFYNDQWGHSQGDILLIHVGKILKKAVGKEGIVARYSGDEFMIFLPAIKETEVPRTIRRVNSHLEEASFPGEECFPNRKLTVSFGAVYSSGAAPDCAGLIVKADRALYQAKKHR